MINEDEEWDGVGDNTLLEVNELLVKIHHRVIQSAYERNMLYGILSQLVGNDEFVVEFNKLEGNNRLVLEPIEDEPDEEIVKYKVYMEKV